MSELVINCPKCGKGLKVRDRSNLGKKAGCPKCRHTFVLQVPQDDEDDSADEVQFELASESQNQTLVGTAARWIPDEAAAPAPAAAAAAKATKSAKAKSSKSASRPAPTPEPEDEPVAEEFDDDIPSRTAKLTKKQMPKLPKITISRKQRTRLVAAVATLVVILGGVWAAMNATDGPAKPKKGKPKKPVIAAVDEEPADDPDSDDGASGDASAVAETPISTWGLPMGARVLISLRPAELWEAKSRGEEVRYCLGPFGIWAEKELKAFARADMPKVEHMVVALFPGVLGEVPQAAAVVRFKADIANSQFINDFGGNRTDQYGYPVYVAEKFAFIRKPNDQRTVAIVPVQYAQEVAQAVQQPVGQSDGIDALLPKTDEGKHLTVIFEPRAVRRHHEKMFDPKLYTFANLALDWFNDDEIETVVWSMQFGKEKFDSKILMRNYAGFSEPSLDREMRKKIKDLPSDLWKKCVDKMNPTVAGHRKIIGRFPAMMQMFARETKGGIGTRYTLLETSLTERAAPNLALGALLTWDQSLVTDFSAGPSKGDSAEEKLPDLIADRLKKKIDIEFARTPLQDAFKYIAQETKCGHDIDGDALKDKGYTKNMPQTFTMNDTGFAAIKKIISAYPDMCLVIDEGKKEFLITTTKFASEKGQKVYEIK